jgi:hypothetical protein
MGILDTLGEVAGAIAAVEGAEKLDPNASLLTKGVAAIAGFKGVGAIENAVKDNQLRPQCLSGCRAFFR